MPVVILKQDASGNVVYAKTSRSKWIKILLILMVGVQFLASCTQNSNNTATLDEQKLLNDVQENNVPLMLDWKISHSDNNTCTVVIMYVGPDRHHVDMIEPHRPEKPKDPSQPCPLGIYCLSDPMKDGERWQKDITEWQQLDELTKKEDITKALEESYMSIGTNRKSWADWSSSTDQGLKIIKDYIVNQSIEHPFTIENHPLP